ncbi:DUF7827 domain-containing protein [Halorubrum halodurans]|uniref:DUF7827 domain-containing protein n=1 Tax=Halorubrum halodurans TaxID=1383851 RepID=A0A256IBZ8_9EURY|nr:hypothetical protein [Halorubrum halodurans]OYR53993.1 hypothetical protein DJ70_15135 [Halorubrum halodurans]
MNTRPALVVLVVMVALIAPITTVTAQSDIAVGFGDSQSTVTQGDVATIDLQLRNTEEADLRVRSSDRSFRATLRVRDGDNDGTVRVRFNTFRATSDDRGPTFVATDAADDVETISSSYEGSGDVLDSGRYNLIVSTAETSVASKLYLEEPGDAGGSNTTVVAPETPLPRVTTDVADSTTSLNIDGEANVSTAATGDHIRTRFSVPGLGGIVDADPPVRNFVFAANSSPGARTTHTMSISPNESVSVHSMTIDYHVGSSSDVADVSKISQSDIKTLGIDTTGDGYIDRSELLSIQNIRTESNGRLTVTFDQSIDINANDSFFASYIVRNPNVTGSHDVGVTLYGENETVREEGIVLYGPAGQGTLGYGVDLRIKSVDQRTEAIAPLATLKSVYDSDANDLVAEVNTSELKPGEYEISLSVDETAPETLPRTELTERVTVAEPEVALEDPSIGSSPRLVIDGDTNLAPSNSLIVRVEAMEINGAISQIQNCVAIVESDGSINCEFNLEKSTEDFDIEVTVERRGTVIAGPVEYN